MDSSCFGFFSVYQKRAYYVVYYGDSLLDQTGEEGNVPFEERYNTEIRCLDMESGEDFLVYKYHLDYCIQVFDMQARDNRIVWVEIPAEGGWAIMTLDLDGMSQPEEILSNDAQPDNEFSEIVLTLAEEKVYWYGFKEGDHPLSLYSYDFSTGDIITEDQGLDQESPYEGFSLISNWGTTLYRESADESTIHIINSDNAEQVDIFVSDKVSDPITNENLCVWRRDYESPKQLYVYHRDSAQTGVINVSPAYIFSYGILGDKILVNQQSQYSDNDENEGLYCYDLDEKIFQKIDLGNLPDSDVLTIFQGAEGELYTSISTDGNVFVVDIQE